MSTMMNRGASLRSAWRTRYPGRNAPLLGSSRNSFVGLAKQRSTSTVDWVYVSSRRVSKDAEMGPCPARKPYAVRSKDAVAVHSRTRRSSIRCATGCRSRGFSALNSRTTLRSKRLAQASRRASRQEVVIARFHRTATLPRIFGALVIAHGPQWRYCGPRRHRLLACHAGRAARQTVACRELTSRPLPTRVECTAARF